MKMDHESTRAAFFETCDDAQPAAGHFVSLYAEIPFYGGPEEGGWWGRDMKLIASQKCATEAEAEAKRDAVKSLAEKLSNDARRQWGQQCRRELEWAEALGIDPSDLPETDGETRFHVLIEEKAGEHESQGCRHYE